jgi:hypothetical protein
MEWEGAAFNIPAGPVCRSRTIRLLRGYGGRERREKGGSETKGRVPRRRDN